MRLRLIALALLVVACEGKPKPQAAESAPPAAAPAPAPAPAFNLADAAGTWDYVAKSGDTVLVKAVLTASADANAWTLAFEGRKPIPLKVTVSGDSLLTSAGPYPSVLRKGVQVTTDGSVRMSNGKLVGTSVAHYSVKTADSVRRNIMIEATKRP